MWIVHIRLIAGATLPLGPAIGSPEPCHHFGMGSDFQGVLGDLRAELDELDARLVLLLKERADVISRVIERKASAGLGPVDIKREQEMLGRIAARAEAVGLDPQVARKILRSIIEAFTELEMRELG